MQRSTFFFIILSAAIGLGLFQLKYKVMTLEQQHRQIQKSIQDSEEAIHILKAEWTHLNEPKRLQLLSQKYLQIEAIRADQFINLKKVVGGAEVLDSAALDQLIAEIASDPSLKSPEE